MMTSVEARQVFQAGTLGSWAVVCFQEDESNLHEVFLRSTSAASALLVSRKLGMGFLDPTRIQSLEIDPCMGREP